MKMSNFVHKISKEDGSIAIIVAFLFIFIVFGISALVLDLGYSYHIASELQNLLDNTALAAVMELPIKPESGWDENDAKLYWSNNIEAVISNYASLNNIDKIDGLNEVNNLVIKGIKKDKSLIDKNDINEGNIDDIYGIYIEGTAYVNNNFASYFGNATTHISRMSKAMKEPTKTVSGILPLGIPETALEEMLSGSGTTIKLGPQVEDEFMKAYFVELDNSNGWRGAINFLDPNNTDTNSVLPLGKYQDSMPIGGFPGDVKLYDPVEVKSGNMPIDVSTNIIIGQRVIVPIINLVDGKLKIVEFAEAEIVNLQNNSGVSINDYIGDNFKVSAVTIKILGLLESSRLTD